MIKPLTMLVGTCALTLVVSIGCTKSSDSTTTTTSAASGAPAASEASPASAPSVASAMQTKTVAAAAGGSNVPHGKTLYAANCASCHGAVGTEGGVGPSLKGEKSKKNQAAAVAWIKNPVAPMPKLYPSPLSEKDVNDVAAYVETL